MDQNFEKLGKFYLGRMASDAKELLLYDANHLTTHGMIVGMTGSGKTGLAISLIEEAAIDGIPSILIDPKGDLADLLLQFPEFKKEDFLPWVDSSRATREGISAKLLATKTAELWKTGLAKWGEDGDRIRRLSSSADFAVYTPGDTTGRPLQILRSFDPPVEADETTFRDLILNNVSGLLGLVGIEADPVQSREHILLSAVFYTFWKEGKGLELEDIINAVVKPTFSKIGVFDLDRFYPEKDRMKLAMLLNGLLASPGFAAWRAGEPLDVQRLLWTEEGKPRVSILSIAHLSDPERMFFVTAVLDALIAWMRRQSGTGSLRALFYMDEIFGYFPPTANPSSKAPMLTLLKQARAFGLGIVLSTQNPVDLDYKGLSNCGTWFVGRLQTDRDKQRVLDGLAAVSAENGQGFDRASLDKKISGLGKRVFLMRDAAEDAPVVFETRWAMSYLCGPISSRQLKTLLSREEKREAAPPILACPGRTAVRPDETEPALSPDSIGMATASPIDIAATVRLHFVLGRAGIDQWESRFLRAPVDGNGSPLWKQARETEEAPARIPSTALDAIPDKKARLWGKIIASRLYQEAVLAIWRDPASKLFSDPGESEGDFRIRIAHVHREKRDAAIEKIQVTYSNKLTRLEDQLRRAENRIEREKAQSTQKKLNAFVWLGSTVLGAFLGKGRGLSGTIGRAGTTARSASRIGKEIKDVEQAEEAARILRERYQALQVECEEALDKTHADISPEGIRLETISIRPRKADIFIESLFRCR